MTIHSIALRMLLAIAIVVTVAACREEEQNRPLSYDKGTYAGPPDTRLSDETLKRLRDRTRNQAGGSL